MIGHACVGSRGLGDYPRATANFEAALGIAQAADLQWHIGPTLLGLDHVRACSGRYGQAWLRIGETMRWLESLQQVRYQLIAHDFIGQLLLDLDLNERAVEQLERGQTLARDSGIRFWSASIDTQVAVARARLGEATDMAALQARLEQTRGSAERYLSVRCLDGLAEIALAGGDAAHCRAYANELLAIAEANGLRELEASARRWRGEAALAEKAYAQAHAELTRAAALAACSGTPRRRWPACTPCKASPMPRGGTASARCR
jgi:tetratricopeptide (TPR) repeat protein